MGGFGRTHIAGRSPRGERGLKFVYLVLNIGLELSLPSRGAWIEIVVAVGVVVAIIVAPLAGSVD